MRFNTTEYIVQLFILPTIKERVFHIYRYISPHVDASIKIHFGII